MKKAVPSRRHSALEALNEAHRLAISPFVFQAMVAMTDLGLFKALDDAGETGLTLEALQAASGCDEYTARSLLEVAVRFDVVKKTDANYSLTDTGIFFVNDLHVGINFRFTRDVCYEGLTHLTDSFKESRPAGLKVFGEWPTIYPGIQKLPPAAKKSWFEFDHTIRTKPIRRLCRWSLRTVLIRSRTWAAIRVSGPSAAAIGVTTFVWR